MDFLDAASKLQTLGVVGILSLIVIVLAWAYWQKDKQLKDERLSVQKERLEQAKDLMTLIEKKSAQDAKLESTIDALRELILDLRRAPPSRG